MMEISEQYFKVTAKEPFAYFFSGHSVVWSPCKIGCCFSYCVRADHRGPQNFGVVEARPSGIRMGHSRPLRNTLLPPCCHAKFHHSRSNQKPDPPEKSDLSRAAFQGHSRSLELTGWIGNVFY